MTARLVSAALWIAVCAAPAAGQPLVPGARYAEAIPTIRQVLGYEPGDAITPPDRIVAYLQALHAAAPDRTRLVEYGRSWEGRPLVLLIVGSPERIAHLDEVQAGVARLADPRTLARGEDDRLIAALPVTVWLMHAVHGNELSSSEAALFLAYHLLAVEGDPAVDAIRRDVLVLIDPLQNPDGRARFVAQYTLARAATPDPTPIAAEHDEPWPGGRGNHYLFDLNRDWFAQSQRETAARVRVALTWFPQVTADLHEMSGNATYYFAPPADPLNPYLTDTQVRWLEAFGRANAARFDARGFPYFVREVYDEFYPGYGDSWPAYQGAIGMTFETASSRGLVFRRDDESLLTYRDGIVRHVTAALTTLATAAGNRQRLLRDFVEFRRSAIAEGEKTTPREYVLVPGGDPSRARRLAELLASQGIEVRQTEEPAATPDGVPVAPGAYAIAAAQPAGRLVRNLLEPQVPQPEAFVREQDRRRRKRLGDQIYDVTGWSLPALAGVEVRALDRPIGVKTAPLTDPASRALPRAAVGYLLPWGFETAALTSEALRAGIRVRQASEALTISGREYAAGTAIVRTSENDAAALGRLETIAARHPSVEIVPIDTGWPDAGISLGSEDVVALKASRVLLAWDTPTSSASAGWARFVLERRFGQPVTIVRVESFGDADLHEFDVVVLPSGDYAGAIRDEQVRRLKEWIRQGGTLVTLADASRWAADDKVDLLAAPIELRGGRPDKDDAGSKPSDTGPRSERPFDFDKAIQPARERPENTPGAIVRVTLDQEHWLSAGEGGEVQTIVEGRRVFTPITLDKGRNVGVYAARGRLVAGGLMWDEARDQLARKAFLVEQPLGRGHVVAFAEDPNYRAFSEGTELLFVNAVLLGPAYH